MADPPFTRGTLVPSARVALSSTTEYDSSGSERPSPSTAMLKVAFLPGSTSTVPFATPPKSAASTSPDAAWIEYTTVIIMSEASSFASTVSSYFVRLPMPGSLVSKAVVVSNATPPFASSLALTTSSAYSRPDKRRDFVPSSSNVSSSILYLCKYSGSVSAKVVILISAVLYASLPLKVRFPFEELKTPSSTSMPVSMSMIFHETVVSRSTALPPSPFSLFSLSSSFEDPPPPPVFPSSFE